MCVFFQTMFVYPGTGQEEELVSTSLGLGFPQVSTTEGEIAQNIWLIEGGKQHVTTIF